MLDHTFAFIYCLLFVHWIADFVLQSDNIAKNKSHDNWLLFNHVAAYSYVLWFCLLFITSFNFKFAGAMFIINGGTHFIIDYITSRLNTKLYKQGKIHEFFVSVGLDQFLHVLILILSYSLLRES